MRRIMIYTVFLLFCGLVAQAQSPNPDYDPQWTIGDSWRVAFTILVSGEPKRVEQPLPHTTQILYKYTVIAQGTERGRNVVKILVEPESEGWSKWQLTFDTNELLLLSVEEIDGAETIKHVNPFGDAWMAKLREYSLVMIHDFPKIPSAGQDESRDLTPKKSGTSGFTQTATFDADRVRVVLSRIDAASGLTHKTTIVWEQGKKWWTSAVTELGGDMQVSAVLVL